MKRSVLKSVSLVLAVVSFFAYMPKSAAETNINEMFEAYHIENAASGEFGALDYRIVDENGNEVDMDNPNDKSSSENGLFTKEDFSPLPFAYSASIPSAYSSMEEGYVTAVKNQGDANNCWAYSTMSMLESDSIIKGYETLESADYSESHITWFSGRSLTPDTNDLAYGDGRTAAEPYDFGGNWMIAAGVLSRWSGVANEEDFPSYPYDVPAMGNYSEADRYNNSAGIVLESAQVFSDFYDMKQWIVDHGSVTAMIYYDDASHNYSTNAYYYPEAVSINHQIVIIGWDDNYSASNFNTTPSGNGAWLCKNSWSTRWGDEGCFWISYYDKSISTFVGFSGMQSADYYKNYTYNGAEYNSLYGITAPIILSNVFTASGKEKLSSVAFYTVGTDVDVTVSVYKNINSNYTSPIQGTLAYSENMIIERQGYHTVHLDNEISLGQGEIFSVVIRYYDSDQERTLFAVEAADTERAVYACRSKESYFSIEDGSSHWYESQTQGFKNFFIQAFTKCDHQLETKTEGLTCTEDGTESVFCTQCGKVESETPVYHSGHIFGKWSQFGKDINGEEVSTRACINCDLTETRKLVFMNVITLPDVIEMLFSHIIQFVKRIFI